MYDKITTKANDLSLEPLLTAHQGQHNLTRPLRHDSHTTDTYTYMLQTPSRRMLSQTKTRRPCSASSLRLASSLQHPPPRIYALPTRHHAFLRRQTRPQTPPRSHLRSRPHPKRRPRPSLSRRPQTDSSPPARRRLTPTFTVKTTLPLARRRSASLLHSPTQRASRARAARARPSASSARRTGAGRRRRRARTEMGTTLGA